MKTAWLARVLPCAMSLALLLAATHRAASAELDETAVAQAPSPEPCVWASGEYLLWWVKGQPLRVPLVTTGPFTPGQPVGVLGQPGTQVLLSNETLDFGPSSGGRFTLGGWLAREQTLGIEGNYLFLDKSSARRRLNSSGATDSPVLTFPFFDATTGQESSSNLALPGVFSGAVLLKTSTQLQSAEANGIYRLSDGGGLRLDVLGGFRWLQLNENLLFVTSSPFLPPRPLDVYNTVDGFQTRNDFYGGQLGMRGEWRHGCWVATATGKVALGGTQEVTRIGGRLNTNDFTQFAQTQTYPGGYLGLPTNNGQFSRDKFAVVPEVNVNIGWEPASCLRLFVGYSFLYISSVSRPGDQIDRTINPTQSAVYAGPNTTLAGAARPAFLGRDGDFWAHGLNFGVEVRY